MGRSRLLDYGRETILVYPEETVVNARGQAVKRPSETPVEVRITSSTQRSGDAELPGQVSIKLLRCIARDVPAGSWARVVYRGEEYDIAAPPRHTPGASRNTQHWEFTIRSRNKLAGDA